MITINLFFRFGMMSKGDEGSWSIMLDRFRSEENAQEKNKLLYGLGNLTTSLRFSILVWKVA
jgi:hypothetical protein